MLVAAAGHVLAQSGKLPRVVFAHPGIEASYRPQIKLFRDGMRELGYVEERNISIDIRWADNSSERFADLVNEVVAQKPDVIVTMSSAGVAAFKKATSTIPVVFTSAGNPVEQGFVSSLRRPGGNITGVVVFPNLTGKLAEVVRQALPRARRLALLVDEADPAHRMMQRSFESSARQLDFEPIIIRVTRADDFGRAFGELAARKADAAIASQLTMLTSRRAEVAKRALAARLPLFANNLIYAESGALLAYGVVTAENYHRAAALVDKILRGANPGELAVEQPERFRLVVNQKTARAIGVTLPPVIMMRADKVID